MFSGSAFKPTQVADPREYNTTNVYDVLYRITSGSVAYGDGSAETQYEYDEVGNCTQVTNPLDRWTQYQFDALNRVTQVTYPDYTTTQKSYTSMLSGRKRTRRGV